MLTPSSREKATEVYPFELIAEGDPNLALAGLRIEVEKSLRRLAEAHGVSADRSGVRPLMRLLSQKRLLAPEENDVLADLLSLLDSAVHGADVDARAAGWAIEVGPQLLRTLDGKSNRS